MISKGHSGYDNLAGHLLRVIDPAGNQTSNSYNKLGQLVTTTVALGRTTSYQYDAALALAQSYAPFGEVLASAGNGKSVFQYAGEVRDTTGLTFLRARYQDNGVGRFMSKDPWNESLLQPMSFNLYLYSYNNPIMYTDPSGRFPSIEDPLFPDGNSPDERFPQKMVKTKQDNASMYRSVHAGDTGVYWSQATGYTYVAVGQAR